MEQKDSIKKEIERITLFLAKLLGKLFGFDVLTPEEIEKLEQELETDIIYSAIRNAKNAQELDQLLLKCNYNEMQLEYIADILKEIGMRSNDNFTNKELYLQKSLQLYNYINSSSQTYSIPRNKSIKIISQALASL